MVLDVKYIIQQREFMVSDNNDVTLFFKQPSGVSGATVIVIPDIDEKITQDMVHDAIMLSKSQYLKNWPDSSGETYSKIRYYVVDEKLPIPPNRPKKHSKAKGGKSRYEQVKDFVRRGETSPTAIARKIGTNSGYVARLLKRIKDEQTAESNYSTFVKNMTK